MNDPDRVDIQAKLQHIHDYDPSSHSISEVPDFLRGVNNKAYDPTIVAIGPIHHYNYHVRGMEQHKLWYLHQLLERTGHNIEGYLAALRDSEVLARQYYSSSIQLPDNEEFLEMLLLDGVFIIELARKWSSRTTELIRNDYIFQYSEVHYNEVLIQIRRDLLMIENQVPFFILTKLFDMTRGDADNNGLQQLLLHFFRRIIPGEPEVNFPRDGYVVDDHLFGLVYQAFFSPTIATPNDRFSRFNEINSTSELQEAGIKFKKAEQTTLMDVKFKDGVLEIPKLEVGDVTESIFRNLIAYEQVRVDNDQTQPDDSPRYVTEYCFLMQFLVNTKKDVEILRRAGIVINWMGDDETLHLFFNKLTKNVATSQDFYYAKIIMDMNEYSSRFCIKFWVDFKRKYLKGPWAITSVLAALILLLLTIAQVVFAALSYKNGTPTRGH